MRPRAVVLAEKVDMEGPRVWVVFVTEINIIRVMSTKEKAISWATEFNEKGYK